MNSNGQVARWFAQGWTCGASLHMFIDGDCVYSYGRHFCIARRLNGKVLLTTRTYSNTTAKHIREVWRALRGSETIRCYDPAESVEFNLEKYDEEIAELEQKVRRARTHKAGWQALLENVQEHRQKYMDMISVMGVDNNDKYKQPFDN